MLKDADAILVTNETNVRYLTGFTGDSSYLIVTRAGDPGALILSDPRYEEQLEEQCPELSRSIRRPSDNLVEYAIQHIGKLGISRLLIEAGSMNVAMYDRFRQESKIELLRGEGEVEQLREIKDADEIRRIRRAISTAQQAFLSLREQLHAKISERELAYELEHTIRKLGGEGCSFKPIVAAGPRSALPHAEPGMTLLGEHPFVLIDWGATYEGYRSDLTRVLLTSRIPAKISRAYDVVLAAQQAAIHAMRGGVSVEEVDRAARDVIAEAGMAKRFNHGLGHGIGLDIHESPRLGSRSRSMKGPSKTLQPGMVVTVEPGVYYPGLGGIRIEDDVLIHADGAEVLSSLPRGMQENRVEFLS